MRDVGLSRASLECLSVSQHHPGLFPAVRSEEKQHEVKRSLQWPSVGSPGHGGDEVAGWGVFLLALLLSTYSMAGPRLNTLHLSVDSFNIPVKYLLLPPYFTDVATESRVTHQ